jgi:hypothetical protein
LIEALAGLAIGAAAITMAVWLGAVFVSNRETAAAGYSNLRLQIDELGFALQQDLADAPQAYWFAGGLLNANGTPYAGTALTFNRPLYQIKTAGDFLNATGLTVSAPGAGTLDSIIAVAAPAQPIFVTRQVTTATGGWTSVRVQYCGRFGTRRCVVTIPPTTTGTRATAAAGSVALDSADSHVVLTLPNPLAITTAMLPQVNPGMAVAFNLQLAQAKP